MTDDLIERLRSVDVSWSETGEWCAEAADRIEALTAEVERLRGVIQHYGDIFCEGVGECVGDFCGRLSSDECSGCYARAALAGDSHE